MTPGMQRSWRIAGAVCLLLCGVLVWFGDSLTAGAGIGFLAAYWGLCLAALLGALFCVLLDLRYIRAEYALERREIFQDTLGDENFRAALLEAQREKAAQEQAAREQAAREQGARGQTGE